MLLTGKKYRRERNLVVRLRKSSRANYLKSVGKGSSNPKEFWSSVKPLMSNKCKGVSEDLVLLEEGQVINDQQNVSDMLNVFSQKCPFTHSCT